MNDAADTITTAESNPAGATNAGAKDATTNEAAATSSPQRNGDGRSVGPVDGKSDSEAETVVLPGKERNSASPPHRAIKHEGAGDGQPPVENGKDGDASKKDQSEKPDQLEPESAKSKKSSKEHTANSSNLSSTKSSPAPEGLASSRAGSEAAESKTRSVADSDSVSRSSQSRKRKNPSDDVDDKTTKRRYRRDGSLESARRSASVDREGRNIKKNHNGKSESPPPRTRQRAQSIKEQGSGSATKRRKPPPLQVGPSSRTNDDGDGRSNESGSHFRRLASGEAAATSPAKIPPHKKLRDRNGRTFLARICDGNDTDAVRARLEERPEDLDVADYAGNTPLQIASLAGNHEIVKILLDAGCKTDCKNVDQDTPLIDAVENGCLEVIKLLLDAGLNPRQSNAKGEQLIDLLDPEDEDYEEIKSLILKAQKLEHRQSKEHSQPAMEKDSNAQPGLRSSSSVQSPPPASAARRRAGGRREATRNDLLWISTTRENLREKARIGDDTAVDYILSINPGAADVYATLAAARGGHETALSFLLAIGGSQIEADPDLLAGEKPSQGTPMLAAIGRGNTRVLELLLKQPGFNPTRRWNKKTYWELAKERRGLKWEEEYRLLKDAYNKHKAASAGKDSPSASKTRNAEEGGSPAHSEQKSMQSTSSKETLVRKKSNNDARRSDNHDDESQTSPERNRQLSKKYLQVPSKSSSREQSVAVSDREVSPARRIMEKKAHRSLSEAEVHDDDAPKPRKRLVSKRDLKDGEKQRRTSIVSAPSSSGPERGKPRLEHEHSSQKIKTEEGQERTKSVKADLSKKRPRPSTTSPEAKSPDARRSPDDVKKVKKPRVEGDAATSKRGDHELSLNKQKSAGKEKSAGQARDSTAASATTTGGSASAQSKDSGKPSNPRNDHTNAAQSRKSSVPPSHLETSAAPKNSTPRENTPQRDTYDQLQREMEAAAADAERRKRKSIPNDQERPGKERRSGADTNKDAASQPPESKSQEIAERHKKTDREESERKTKAERDEKERKAQAKQEEAEREAKAKEAEEAARRARAKEAEEAVRMAKAKEAEEAARKAKAEQEEAERKAKAEKEEAERKAKAEREAEEARLERQRQEEELAHKVAERERLRREEDERQARRRREQAERERLALERKKQEEEERRLDALPRAYRMLAEKGPEWARQFKETKIWLPLCAAQGRQLDPECEPSAKMELWVPNIQVAPILGIADLDLSQCKIRPRCASTKLTTAPDTAWTKRPATTGQQRMLWRRLRIRIVHYRFEFPPFVENRDLDYECKLDSEARLKFLGLKNVFWIRLSDLLDIVPRYPHLAGLELTTDDIYFFGAIHPKEPEDAALPPLETESEPVGAFETNGVFEANGLTNGIH